MFIKVEKKTRYQNLLIISGTSARSGKTTMACRLIEQFSDHAPVAIKVSSHFHTKSAGLLTIAEGPGYAVYQETEPGTVKDTGRMLSAGAAKVFLILVWENNVETVFRMLIDSIPEKQPVICESPGIRRYVEPGVFIIMDSENPQKRQDIIELQSLPHLEFNLNGLSSKEIPVTFINEKWELI